MTKTNTQKRTEKLALLSLMTALVALLSYFGGFIKIGALASVSLTLVPVVLGAALMGSYAGAWLGAVSGIVFFFTADAAFWFGLSVPGTVITVMLKGIAAGFFAGIVYKALAKKNEYLAVLTSAVVCPIVNTGIFIIGCLIFFMDNVAASAAAEGISIFAFLIIFYVGLNFVFELLANIILAPMIMKVLNIRRATK